MFATASTQSRVCTARGKSSLALSTGVSLFHQLNALPLYRELTVKTGNGDLGGFLRLRIGDLLPQYEKVEEDDSKESNDDADADAADPEDGVRLV